MDEKEAKNAMGSFLAQLDKDFENYKENLLQSKKNTKQYDYWLGKLHAYERFAVHLKNHFYSSKK